MKPIAFPVPNKRLLYTAGALLLLCLCIFLATRLTACGNEERTPSDTQAQTEATTQPPTETTVDDSLRTFYESMIAELEEKLLSEKQDNYIARLEYESRLELLERELEAIASNKEQGDLSVSGRPDTAPEESTTATETATETETEDPRESSFRYTVEGEEVVICQYLGTSRDVVIPSEIESYPVTRIADNAFTNANIQTVSIPNTVKSIGWFAFYGCYSLESVTIPSSVTRIEYAAFDNCPTLTILCVPETYAASYAVSFGLRHRYL